LLTVTEAAARKIEEAIAQVQEPVFGLRVAVRAGGCSGWEYGLMLAPEAETHDWVGEFGGIKVLVDPQSAVVLEGASIDWVETTQGAGFTITNPMAVRGCGCGKSFHTEASDVEAETAAGCGCGGGGCGCGGH